MTSKILFVGHDANGAGAQIVLLYWLKAEANSGKKNYVLLEKGGELLPQYERYAKVWVWRKGPNKIENMYKKIPFLKREDRVDREPNRMEIAEMLKNFRREKFSLILGNTVASLSLLQQLQGMRISFGAYVHELNFSLSMYASEKDMAFLAQKVSLVFGVSEQVNRLLVEKFNVPVERTLLLPPIIDIPKNRLNRGSQVREQLGIPKDAMQLIGTGLAEWRKGTDIFIRVARQVIRKMPKVHFIWLGVGDNVFSAELQAEKDRWDECKQVHLVPRKLDSKPYFESMDLFFLSSREDPFPLVMLEAAFHEKPLVGFNGSGGVNDFLKDFPAMLVGYLEEEEARDCIIKWLKKDLTAQTEITLELKDRSLQYSADRFLERWHNMDLK
jgi:glycosyltransferase involved in cell wall biosynthesis